MTTEPKPRAGDKYTHTKTGDFAEVLEVTDTHVKYKTRGFENIVTRVDFEVLVYFAILRGDIVFTRGNEQLEAGKD